MKAAALALLLPVAAGAAEPSALFLAGGPAGPACAACHGRDGEGGGEARTPPVTWRALSAPGPQRPAYDAASFAAALRDGRDPGGRVLARLMPRYALDEDDIAGLRAYLQGLPALQRRGVTPDRVTLGVAAPARYLDALRSALSGRRFYGRRVELLPVAPDAEAAALPILALLAPPSAEVNAARTAADSGVPVLFPLEPLRGDESAQAFRSFVPSLAQDAQRLAEAVATEAPQLVVMVAAKDDPFAAAVDDALRHTLGAGARLDRIEPGDPLPGAVSDVVLLADAPASATRIWTVGLPSATATGEARVLLPGGPLLKQPATATLPKAHATLTAALVAAALASAGRDVTRTRLMRALGDVGGDVPALDYRRFPLTGTDAGAILAGRR